MKKQGGKVLSLVLALVMVFSLLPVSVLADNETNGNFPIDCYALYIDAKGKQTLTHWKGIRLNATPESNGSYTVKYSDLYEYVILGLKPGFDQQAKEEGYVPTGFFRVTTWGEDLEISEYMTQDSTKTVEMRDEGKNNNMICIVYEYNRVTLTYHFNDDDNTTATQAFVKGDTVTVDGNDKEKSGFVFQGWDTSSNAETAVHKPAAEFTITEDTDLYAVWQHTHSYTVTKAPTCTEKGEETCSICGDTQEIGSALGHTFDNAVWYDNNDDTHARVCDRCHGDEQDGNEIQTEYHSYDDDKWVVVEEATTENPGLKRNVCTAEGCDHVTTRPIAKLPEPDHTHSYVQTKEPNCTDMGVETCECGDTRSIPTNDDHDMRETAAAVPATCEIDGNTAVMTCANGCGKTEGGAKIPAPGSHDMQVVPNSAKPATCTAPGKEADQKCSRCDYKETGAEIAIAPLNHDWGEWEVTTPATCEGKAVETRVCSRDSEHKETRETETLGGHIWPETWSDNGAEHKMVCTRLNCEETKTEDHSYEWTVVKEASLEELGQRKGVCTAKGCGHTTSEDIPMLKPDQTPSTPVVTEIIVTSTPSVEPSAKPSQEPAPSQDPVPSQEPTPSEEPAPVEGDDPGEEIDEPDTPMGALPEDPVPELPGDSAQSGEPEEDINDVDAPMAELPDDPSEEVSAPAVPDDSGKDAADAGGDVEDMDDPRLPMADVPQTGDNLAVWAVAAAVSGVSLMGVIGSTRKRKEDEEA